MPTIQERKREEEDTKQARHKYPTDAQASPALPWNDFCLLSLCCGVQLREPRQQCELSPHPLSSCLIHATPVRTLGLSAVLLGNGDAPPPPRPNTRRVSSHCELSIDHQSGFRKEPQARPPPGDLDIIWLQRTRASIARSDGAGICVDPGLCRRTQGSDAHREAPLGTTCPSLTPSLRLWRQVRMPTRTTPCSPLGLEFHPEIPSFFDFQPPSSQATWLMEPYQPSV